MKRHTDKQTARQNETASEVDRHTARDRDTTQSIAIMNSTINLLTINPVQVITSLSKRGNDGIQSLTANELRQMCSPARNPIGNTFEPALDPFLPCV